MGQSQSGFLEGKAYFRGAASFALNKNAAKIALKPQPFYGIKERFTHSVENNIFFC